MDVISLSKANKTLSKIKQLDESVVAPLAEDRFPTIDARLDWLEGQAEKIKAENSKKIDLNQGIFNNTELKNGKIQLKEIKTGKFFLQGIWESPIIDLGEGWKGTKLIEIVNQIKMGITNCILEISVSSDGKSFSDYTSLDPNNPLQGRYIKLKTTLSAQAQSGQTKTLDFNQSSSENMMTLNEYTEANGKLQLKNTYTYNMTDDGALRTGKQFSFTVNRANFKSIKSIGVN